MVDGVILLHGILRGNRCMRKIAQNLETNGFAVLNLNYPSTKHKIQDLADIIASDVQSFASQIDGKLHFVGHSMGGLLSRTYLHKYQNHDVGRVVLLGVPNSGSEAADFFQNWRLYKWLYGASGQQLITKGDLAEIIGKPYYEVGAIAGNKTVDPICSFIIKQPNDGKVSLKSALLESAHDKIILPASHTSMPSHPQVIAQTLYFLQNGAFRRNIA